MTGDQPADFWKLENGNNETVPVRFREKFKHCIRGKPVKTPAGKTKIILDGLMDVKGWKDYRVV
ncbi:MAG: hypothetical protein KIS76_04050 [Pyrinomonadaceae bacterium]|nr:hypothetical protein [Pyrinomonadaceae bacterium]